MKPFKKRRRGGFVAAFEVDEALLLANLAAQVIELLADRNSASESDPDPLAAQLGLGGPSLAPDDPVLLRLLPDAYSNDEAEAADYRRLTERSLAATKVANAETILSTLGEGGLDIATPHDEAKPIEVELNSDQAVAWLKALNDIRLSLAVRLEIESEEDAYLAAHSSDESKVAMGEIYNWLSFVQETLVASLG